MDLDTFSSKRKKRKGKEKRRKKKKGERRKKGKEEKDCKRHSCLILPTGLIESVS